MSTSNNLPDIYDEKEDLQEHPEIPNINKISASDMNLIREFLQNALYQSGDRISDINNQLLDLVMPRYEKEIIVSGNSVAVKYDNGMLFCSGKKAFNNVAVNSPWGNIYSGSSLELKFDDYPVPFIEEPALTVSGTAKSLNYWIYTSDSLQPTKTNPGAYQLARGTAGTVSGVLNYTAFGWWKKVVTTNESEV